MTQLDREKRNEAGRQVKGQKALHIIEAGRVPHNKSYFCIRETACGYYVQSFDTVVLYVSKRTGKLVNTWGGYTRGTMIHMNLALKWISENTETRPERKRLSGEQYIGLPTLKAGARLYAVAA